MSTSRTVLVLSESEAAARQLRFDAAWSEYQAQQSARGASPDPTDYYVHAALWAREMGAEAITIVPDRPTDPASAQ